MNVAAVPDRDRLRTCSPAEHPELVEQLVGRRIGRWGELDVIERGLVRRLAGYAVGRPLPLEMIDAIDSLEEVFRLARELQPTLDDRPTSSGSRGPTTDYVHLREWRVDDLPALYAAAIRPTTGTAWRFQGATPSMEDFSRTFGRDTLATHIVARNQDDIAVGSVSCYSPSFDNGWAYIGFQRCRIEGMAELMFEGIFGFISWVFDTWPFRQLYAEVNGGLMSAMPSLGRDAGTVCGVLPAHTFKAGAYEDVHVVVFTRERWSAFARTVDPLVAVRG